jgi:hypothetical protein
MIERGKTNAEDAHHRGMIPLIKKVGTLAGPGLAARPRQSWITSCPYSASKPKAQPGLSGPPSAAIR